MKILKILVLVVMVAVPTWGAVQAQAADLAGTQWQLASYGDPGAATPVVTGSTVTLVFASGNNVAGNGGCNTYSSTYSANGTALTFGDVVRTEMACVNSAITAQEQVYFAALETASAFTRTGDQLAIQYVDGQVLNFVQVNAPAVNTAAAVNGAATTNNQPTQPPVEFENLDSPVGLLASYYNAIDRQEYQRAYNYWGEAEAPDTYDNFVSGFATTASTQVIVQPPTHYEGAAGSIYVSIPTVLLAQHTDGTQLMYAGCFVARKSNLQPPDIPQPDVWHLYSADIIAVATDSPIPSLLSGACPAP